jgi:hypothetical protein
MKKKNSNAMFNKLVNNKITLYIVAIISLLSLVGNIIYSEFSAILLFFLVGAIAYNYTKNMTIVLASAFLATSIANLSMNLFLYKEGLGNMDSSGNTIPKNKVSEETPESSGATSATSATSADTSISTNQTEETEETEKTEALSQLTPALFNNTPNKEQLQKQLGKATEMEQAYDNLEKIMGKENIQSISTDTKDLIKQQNDLIKQLKTMTPALNEAMTSIGNLDLSKLTGMFSSATKSLAEMKGGQ